MLLLLLVFHEYLLQLQLFTSFPLLLLLTSIVVAVVVFIACLAASHHLCL